MKKRQKFKRWVPLYLMMAPGLIYLFINNYMPMAGLVVAFKKLQRGRWNLWQPMGRSQQFYLSV